MGLFNIDKLKDDLEGYAEAKIALLKLELSEQFVLAISKIAMLLVIFTFIFLGVLFLSIAAALKLNALLNSSHLGFLIVGGIYFIIALSFWIFIDKNNISDQLSDKIRDTIRKS